MKKINTQIYLLILLLGISSCKGLPIKIPDAQGCAVKGNILNGAVCSTMFTRERKDLTTPEFIAFLNPNIETGYEGAIAYRASDLVKIKIALEQACAQLKKW